MKTNEEIGSFYNIDFMGKICPLIQNWLRRDNVQVT